MNFRVRIVSKALLVPVAAAVLAAVVMLLWNAVVPALFADARSIDYLHAFGLLILSRILFGGFRGHGGWHRGRYRQKWESMSPEERAQFRDRMQAHRDQRGAI
jgi:hypothetical protein